MPDCKSCANKHHHVEPVPYIVHEENMARNERTVKRLIIALIVLIVMWFATINIFVWYLNQYDFESYEYTQDGGVNIVGDGNGVDCSASESKNQEAD